jgi:hypothetical protein
MNKRAQRSSVNIKHNIHGAQAIAFLHHLLEFRILEEALTIIMAYLTNS